MQPYQIDPWRWEDEARVLACEARDDNTWAVRTTPTVLYPEGGGQPPDHGALGPARVLDVQNGPDGVVLTTDAPVEVGVVLPVAVDGARRLDHMQQHTGQHLLTAVLHHRFGVETTSFHLGEAHCAIELATDRFDDALRADAEAVVNAEIRAARPVTWRERTADDEGRVRSRVLPSDLDGPIRLVEIEGLDVNTCCGTHVDHLGHLQALTLGEVRSIGRRGVRLSFLVGGRVLRAMEAARVREAALTRHLDTHAEAHVDAVARLQDRLADAERQVRHLGRLVAEARANEVASQPGRILTVTDPSADLPTLQALAGAVCRARPDALLLATGDGVFLLAGDETEVARRGPEVLEALKARGGGARGRLQGRMAAPEGAGPLLERWRAEDATRS